MEINKKVFSTEFAGRPLSFETSKIGEQADAAIIGKYGETIVLATVVMGKEDKKGMDYFPLMVNYEEKFYAIGKILGSRFMRREGKSSDKAVLSGRIVDRTIRPLFNSAMRRQVQVVITTLQIDGSNDPEFISLMTASVALAVSRIPWNGPVAGVKIAKIKGSNDIIINPTISELNNEENNLDFDAFIAGTKDKINMVELGGDEAGEKDILGGFDLAQKQIIELIKFEEEIIKELSIPKEEVYLAIPEKDIEEKINNFLGDKLETAFYNPDKEKSSEMLSEIKDGMKKMLIEGGAEEKDMIAADVFLELKLDGILHSKILQEEKRPDNRKLDEVRDLYAEAGILSRVHGSALFVRGGTQSLALTTIAPPGAEQLLDTVDFSGKKRFILHYNFPPYSVGEIGPFRGPGRRDIGHGSLAEKALKPLIPSKENFPYTIRVVSEILSSNGSSSMATVCAGGLSLMDAGVPIKRTPAGIAMGLIADDKSNDYKILTDIQGPEDHYGDMDFKVAGTEEGITAIQMDVKIQGVDLEIIEKVLIKGKEARLHILKTIQGALAEPRKEVSKFAPVVFVIDINPEKIGEVIGPGGKVINGIIASTGATSIDIDQSGKVYVSGSSKEIAEAALKQVELIVNDLEVGQIVEGNIIKILDFGAILEIGPGKDGMIHVSELKDGFVKKVEDVVKLGDFVRAKVIRSENGKVSLSLKAIKASD
ncbi:polyribonucleotide nucleotidyltransferase [Patescibacteria group bacterium]|nr:polyribonucleotide nucleotidyltransferase [Patescibacteria group bacterium]